MALAALEGRAGFVIANPPASTGWVPFDAGRPHLLRNLETFAAAEEAERPGYAFRWPGEDGAVSAREALNRHRETGTSPLTRWQVQRFVYNASQ